MTTNEQQPQSDESLLRRYIVQGNVGTPTSSRVLSPPTRDVPIYTPSALPILHCLSKTEEVDRSRAPTPARPCGDSPQSGEGQTVLYEGGNTPSRNNLPRARDLVARRINFDQYVTQAPLERAVSRVSMESEAAEGAESDVSTAPSIPHRRNTTNWLNRPWQVQNRQPNRSVRRYRLLVRTNPYLVRRIRPGGPHDHRRVQRHETRYPTTFNRQIPFQTSLQRRIHRNGEFFRDPYLQPYPRRSFPYTRR